MREKRHRLDLGRLGLDERVVALAAHVGLEVLVAELAQLLDAVDPELLRLADDGDGDLDRDLANLQFENGLGGRAGCGKAKETHALDVRVQEIPLELVGRERVRETVCRGVDKLLRDLRNPKHGQRLAAEILQWSTDAPC